MTTQTILKSSTNPLIKTMTSSTLLCCANQLAKIISTLKVNGLDVVVTIEEKIKTLPLLLLHLSPSPTQLQWDDIQARITLLENLHDQLAHDTQDQAAQLHSVIEALQFEFNRLQQRLCVN